MTRHWPALSLGWFFVLALLLHFALTQTPVWKRAIESLVTAAREQPIELVPLNPADEKKPVILTEKAENQADDGEAKFGGEFKNRVKQETQAERRGRFQQGAIRPSVPVPRTPGEGPGAEPQSDQTLSELLAIPQSPNALPKEIAKGSQTLINTDPVRYASFINRIADEIYDSWVAHAEAAADRIYAAGKRLDAQVYVTKVTVTLNRQGNVASIQVMKSSGVHELDEAPKKAFWESEPFPNPPSQMFEEDDLVRFIYEFHFEWRSAGFNIVPFI